MAVPVYEQYGITAQQWNAIVITERVNSSLSILGIFFIVFTYLFVPSFNKPINRLIFFASLGNLGSNIAALISENGISAGEDSAMCKAQAFLVQMFLGVDGYWAFFMSVNVYLIFFRNYTVAQLQSFDRIYLLLCYGLSFILAFIFLFIHSASRGPVYGPAFIWCWISDLWAPIRFIHPYGPVWLSIIAASIVYTRAFRVMWSKRNQLKGFLNPFNENPFASSVITEIEVTYDERPINGQGVPHTSTDGDYAVRVEINATAPERQLPAPLRLRSLTRQIAMGEANADAFLYARVTVLFFIALLITWIPVTVNRLYDVIRPNTISYPLNYIASFVFPLQAFWNCVIYMITSQTAVRNLFAGFGSRSRDNVYLTRGNQRLHSFSDSQHISSDSHRSNELQALPKGVHPRIRP